MENQTKHVNEAYPINEEDIHKLFDGITLGVAFCEPIFDKEENLIDYRFLRVNPAFELQTGQKNSSVLNKTVRELDRDVEQIWIEMYSSMMTKKQSIHFIDYNHHSDRTYSVNSLSFSENKFVIFFEDISDLARSKEKLRKSEDEYQQLFNSMSEMFQVIELIYDDEGNAIDYTYLKVNPAFEQLVQKKSKDLVGKRVKEVLGGIEDYWLKIYEKVDKTGKSETSENYGAELDKYFSIHASKLEERKIAIVFTDITESKKSEAALNESAVQNQNYIQILNEAQRIAKIGNWEWNLLSSEVEWSDTMYELLGYEPNSVEPSYELALKHVHPDDTERYEKTLNEALSNKTEYYFENEIVKTDGTILSVISRGICFLDDNNDLIRMVGTVQDITTQKAIEKKLSEHQRLTAMGEMASSIAHDFNNALQSMLGNLEIIKLQNNLLGSTRERVDNIRSTISDVAGRVKALQRFGDTRIDGEDIGPLSFNTIILESISQSRPLWKDHVEKDGLIVNVVTDLGDIPKVDGNKGELKSAIHNLIKNSIEAMPDGGEIRIKTGTKAQGVFMTITDTGTGMNEETKLKLFQPFYSTKGLEMGRGLGMSGVYSFVKRYGGDISVKRTVLGKGTTIEMVFPVSKRNEEHVIEENSPTDNESFRILWVDDDVSIRESSCEILELLGHNCKPVGSGKHALDFLHENQCDVVITDIGMPEMNGWQLADAIREKIGNEVRIIVVSGWAIDEKTKNDHGVNHVLQKPFSIEELQKIIIGS